MDLRRLRLFLAVVDHGGFTAAATAVHTAQPALSLGVRELERELGATLLVRSRKGVVLTPAGEALVEPARQALRAVEIAAAAVAAVTGVLAGRIDVAALPTLAADPLAGVAGRFHQAHPRVTVRIVAPDDPTELAAVVRSGRSELGFTEQGPANDGLVEHALADQELVAVCPRAGDADLAVLDLAVLDLRRLEGVPLLLTPVGTSMRNLVDGALRNLGITPLIAVETEQRDALVPLVLAGAGTAFVPRAIADVASTQGAVVRRTRPTLRRQVVLVHRAGVLSPAGALFLAHALAGVADRVAQV
ncbi:MAG: LysR family transcriptional regulator [Acidimicrobiales bacterium]